MKSRLLALPVDIIGKLMTYMTLADAISMIASDDELQLKCDKSKLIEKRAANVITEINSKSCSVSGIIDTALLVERGFSTTYHIANTNNVILSYKDIRTCEFGLRNGRTNFSVAGFPMPRGTLLHLLVNEDDRPNPIAEVYFSIEEIYQELGKSYNDRSIFMKCFLDELDDERGFDENSSEENNNAEENDNYSYLHDSIALEELLEFYRRGLDELIENGKCKFSNDYRYIKVILP